MILTVRVTADRSADVTHPGMCGADAAALLRTLADKVQARHDAQQPAMAGGAW